jgi:putative AbiEii toxin of type IV toxin-antitoxin system
MKLHEFRITNFRSIKDTGWCPFATDGVTVLIGQNESGKSSILAALAKCFNGIELDDDDVRIDADYPSISIRLDANFDEIKLQLEGNRSEEQLTALGKYVHTAKGRFEYHITWQLDPNPTAGKSRFAAIRTVIDPALADVLKSSWTPPETEIPHGEEEERAQEETNNEINELENPDVGNAIYLAAPISILFDEQTGLLPNRIDIVKAKNGSYDLSGDGKQAAANYLEIAGIALDKLLVQDIRSRESTLSRGNRKVTVDFATFWNQTIGKRDTLSLRCDLRFYEDEHSGGAAGSPYLIFWISDGQNHLFPKQRSTGVRWFLSFYLQLKASDEAPGGTLFLLDEPGANLHSKAQSDVLHLINKLRDKLIMYSTHSPHMIEYEKLYRVLAVQRGGDEDDTPTTVIHAHRLGGASRDTLSPILTAMGADLSQQEVIRKNNNVILEEMSAFYYLTAFWKLLSSTKDVHFIAATGVSNVELLANMFLGWGLRFAVVVDDDQAGRSAYNNIKRNIFGDDDELSKAKLLKVDGKGIEDIFSPNDFRAVVLEDVEAKFKVDNSQYVKDTQRSKALLAYRFLLKVEKGDMKFEKLSESTQAKIKQLVQGISARLDD